MDVREQLAVLERVKRDVASISTQLAHGEILTARNGIETALESLTEIDEDLEAALGEEA